MSLEHYAKDQHIYDYIHQLDLAGKINYMFSHKNTKKETGSNIWKGEKE